MEVLSLGTIGMKSYRKNLGRICWKCVRNAPSFSRSPGFPTKSTSSHPKKIEAEQVSNRFINSVFIISDYKNNSDRVSMFQRLTGVINMPIGSM